ncbi:MAG: hypothetical protein R3F29_04780 [Planctomycetota bacterium]
MPSIPDRALALAACALLPCLSIPAQDGLRAFGQERFETGATLGSIAHIATDASSPFLAADGVVAMLRADGRIVVQGWTPLGEPPPPPLGVTYEQIAVSSYATGSSAYAFGVALRSDGELTVWGPAANGLQPPALPPGTVYVSVSAGDVHAVALRSDGTAVAWGSNSLGETNLVPLPVGVSVVEVRAMGRTTVLLRSDGLLQTAGSGPTMQPPLPPAGLGYTKFWLGSGHGIARRSDGAYEAWGYNDFGQCDLPTPPAGTDYTAIGLGSYLTVAVRSDGHVESIGFPAITIPPLPVGVVIDEVAVTGNLVLLHDTAGNVHVFGDPGIYAPGVAPPVGETIVAHSAGANAAVVTSGGQLLLPFPGRDDLDPLQLPPLPPGVGYVDVAGSDRHTIALRSDGRVVGWGSNVHGELAIPPLAPGLTYTAIYAKAEASAMLRSDGAAVLCGRDAVPVTFLPPAGTNYVSLDFDGDTELLLRDDGFVQANGYSSLQNVPTLPAGVRWTQVVRLSSWAIGLRSDGTVTGWGTYPFPGLPALPPGVVYVELAASTYALAARRSDGQLVVYASSYLNGDPPTLLDGESFVDLEMSGYRAVARFGPTATYVGYGDGCGGTLPASRLVPRETPRIGRDFELSVFDLPQDLAVLVTGWSAVPPTPLDALGMPGCVQHVSLDLPLLLLGTDGVAELSLPIPDHSSLLGATFVQQAIVLDAAANAAGLVVSQATRGVVGRP